MLRRTAHRPHPRPLFRKESGDRRRQHGFAAPLWLFLPACASLILLATTNHVCQDVAPRPFLWVVPLSLYLLSFVICFDHPRWYVRPLWAVPAVIGIVMVIGSDTMLELAERTLPARWRVAGLRVPTGPAFRHDVLHRHDLPRRTGAAQARTRAADGVLPLSGRRRGAGRHYGRHRGAARLQHVPGMEPRHGLGLYNRHRRIVSGRAEKGPGSAPRGCLPPGSLRAGSSWCCFRKPRWGRRTQTGRGSSIERGISTASYPCGTLTLHDLATARRYMKHGAILHGEQFLAPDKRRTAFNYYAPKSGIAQCDPRAAKAKVFAPRGRCRIGDRHAGRLRSAAR